MTTYKFPLRPAQAARLQRQIAEQTRPPSSRWAMRLFEAQGEAHMARARTLYGPERGPEATPPAALAVLQTTTAAPALDLSAVTLDADGWSSWINWAGGERPVLRGQTVRVRLRDGTVSGRPSAAESWDWKHRGSYGDVTAFRVQARAASDTEGLEPGVYRVFVVCSIDRYSKWEGSAWRFCYSTSKLAAKGIVASIVMLAPGARYLPIKVVV